MRIFSVLALASTLSVPAFAADLGTYRPGSPYHSVIAPAADICQNQCDGDAQCRGWNYVKVNPRAPGVCEFNSKPASPIESAISISGQGASMIAPNLAIGSTNTVRVGTTSKPKPRAAVRTTSPTRRVVRQAVPQQIRPEQTVARRPVQNRSVQNGSLTAQQNLYRQSTGHVPAQLRNPHAPRVQQQAARPQYPQTQARPQIAPQQRLLRDPRIQQRPARAPQFSHNLDGVPQQLHSRPQQPQQRQRQQRQQSQPQQFQKQQSQGRPPIGVPINATPQAALPKGSVNDPVTHENAQARMQEAEMAAAHRAAQMQRMSVEQAQANLFGNLNDDVAAPRPLLELPHDQNAPIATSQSRPTTPIAQEPLAVLAGG